MNTTYSRSERQHRATEAKPVRWLSRSRDEVRDLPKEARRELGLQLFQLQCGHTPLGSKPIRAKIWELRINTNQSWFRLLYFVADDHIEVLRVFQKKSNSIPPAEIELAIKRHQEGARQ